MYLAQGIMALIGSKAKISMKAIYLKPHKKCSLKSFGKNPHENSISCCVLYLFHNIKDGTFASVCFKISDI